MDKKEKMLTPAETAKVLGVCLDSVRRHLRAGKLPGVRIGRNWRIPESQLAAHMGLLAVTLAPGIETTNKVPVKSISHMSKMRSRRAKENDGVDEAVEVLLRSVPARTQIAQLVWQAAANRQLPPASAQQLLDEIDLLLRKP